VDIVRNQLHPVEQMLFPYIAAVFQDYKCSVQSWLEQHEDALQHLPWPAQLSDLNTIKPLRSVLESRWEADWLSHYLSSSQKMFFMKSSTVLHWRLFRTYKSVYSKKDTSCITGKWWHNSIVIKKCVSFTTISIILSIPCVFCRLYVAYFLVCEISQMHLTLYSSNLYPPLFHASGDY
jgi:hypothetical protein